MKNEIILDEISYKYTIIDMKDIAFEDLLYHDHPSAVALSTNRDLETEVKKGNNQKAIPHPTTYT